MCAQISQFYILPREELVRFFSNVKNWYRIFTNVNNRYQILTRVKNWYQILTSVNNHYKITTCQKLVSKPHTCKELVPNPQTCEKLVPNYHKFDELALYRHRCQYQNCEELESNTKCSRFWRYFINLRNTHVHAIWNLTLCVFFIKVWDIGTKYVTY